MHGTLPTDTTSQLPTNAHHTTHTNVASSPLIPTLPISRAAPPYLCTNSPTHVLSPSKACPLAGSLPSTFIHDEDVAFQRLSSQKTPPQINDTSLKYPMVKDSTLSTSLDLQTCGQYPPPTPTQTYGQYPPPTPTQTYGQYPPPTPTQTYGPHPSPNPTSSLHPTNIPNPSIINFTTHTRDHQTEPIINPNSHPMSKYVNDLLVRAGLENSTSQKTPMVSGLKLSSLGSEPCADPSLYRSIVAHSLLLGVHNWSRSQPQPPHFIILPLLADGNIVRVSDHQGLKLMLQFQLHGDRRLAVGAVINSKIYIYQTFD
ncbi:uncharacterized protein G2W53_030417 [Senna tora]|uniref:Uncharacterized protein n=1 Tax=Senna tora TaxID=362788 RepID=A0A834T773_9FABA|nr:uncharacterized protein G2W53_030417 [Senna tora]